MKIIATIRGDFPAKFGIPRQSGLIEELHSQIIFEPEYRNADALRGLEDFSHIWLIWQFSETIRDSWSPTVRPPRLGGNRRMGVFATRSPFRPNPVGLSCVKLDRIDYHTQQGPVLNISGADLMDGTPIYDIKPYLPFTDSRPEATGGFSQPYVSYHLHGSGWISFQRKNAGRWLRCYPRIQDRLIRKIRNEFMVWRLPVGRSVSGCGERY